MEDMLFCYKIKKFRECIFKSDYSTDHVLDDFIRYQYNTKKSDFKFVDVDTLMTFSLCMEI